MKLSSKLKTLLLGSFLSILSFAVLAGPSDDKMLKNYIGMASELANDSFTSVSAQAKSIVEGINGQKDKKDVELYKKIATSAEVISQSKDISEARNEFKTLSEAMKTWFEKEKPLVVDVMFCPMAKAHWLQPVGEATKNPYLGKSMLSCGYSVTKALK